MHVDTPQSRCRFALAHGDITPPANIYHRMWGAAKHDRATGIHRPLRATLTLFTPLDGAQRQFIIALDHCVMGRQEMDNLLDAVSEAADIPREELIVVFSHTHAAGLMGLERGNLPGGDLIAPYLESVATRVAELVKETQTKLQPATILYATGHCNLAAHRDYWDEDNQLWACGYDPDTPADDTVLTARAHAEDGTLLATLVNYACHPTTLAWDNTLISPDYPGAMRETIEEVTGVPCLFLQGASGELGPVEGFVGDTSVADRNGRQLGHAALSAIESLPDPNTRFEYTGPVVSGATLGEWKYNELPDEFSDSNASWQLVRQIIPLPIRPGTPTTQEVETELAKWEKKDTPDARAMAERKRRLLHRLSQLPAGDNFPLEAVVLRLGGAVWIIIQGEHYSVLQKVLRERFPETPLIISTVASHWGASYLPPKELYDKGIYQESIAITAAGSLEKVIETIGGQIEELLK
ncbi:MAG: hypothetical protein QGG55_00050 [Verrucomicrobiota bacterium]|nr:hypothetical protein [Verrucomicrobiota bacterium]